MADAAPALIALDWGTTALRAYLLDAEGHVLESRAGPSGVVDRLAGGFPEAFHAAVAGWPEHLPALACGMVGSAQGWVEAPYAECPADAAALARGLALVPGEPRLRIVPGVALRDAEHADVMRGEETQILGALHLMPGLAAASRLVLPGTHSKWAEVEGGRIARFRTFLTGELFHLLRDHSILGRLAAGKPAPTPERARAAFLRGVEAVRREGRAAPLLFTARSLVLAGGMPAEESIEYLSGLVIAEELAASPVAPGLLLIGAPALCERYRLALQAFGAPGASILDAAEATVAGLREIAGMVAT